MQALLAANQLHPELYVEAFAGGASVALHMLVNEAVDTVGLIEKDPLVAAFWQVVFDPNQSELNWLLDQLATIEINVKHWQMWKGNLPDSRRERALACLYLNRTSFSGILAPSSGPIGGQSQLSPYKIDCRFPRETLHRRICQAAALHERVAFVWEGDWADCLRAIQERQANGTLPADVCYYFDPPFFHKADRLYNFYFEPADHRALRDTVLPLPAPWVISYDYCPEVQTLYAKHRQIEVELLYSGAQNGGSRVAKEIILTNLRKIPSERRLWRSSCERRNGGSSP